MNLTAQEVFDKLVDEYDLLALTGHIRFNLGDVGIVVKTKDVVGNIIQEWMGEWLSANDIDHEPNPNTQMPPDIFLDPDDHTKNLLEIKAFNYNASPGFDIADFKAFVNELIEKPYHLDTDFLIFGYTMDTDNGDVVINHVWLKKMWEIMRPMGTWPITVQYKNDKINKIRPGNWYTESGKYPIFRSKTDLLSAFEETIYQCPDTHTQAGHWKSDFKESYHAHYGEDIEFPRWSDIKDQYGL